MMYDIGFQHFIESLWKLPMLYGICVFIGFINDGYTI